MDAKLLVTPWRYNPATDEIIDAEGFTLAGVCGDRTAPEEDRAIGALMAAAPDLLAAAKKVLAGLNARIDAADPRAVPVFDGIAELSGAINKAEAPNG